MSLDVGLLCQGWEPERGGIERHTRDLTTGLMALGHRVHVLCLDGREGLEPYAVETSDCDGVAVRRMAYRYHDHERLADLVHNPHAEQVVVGWLADTPCDVIHVHHLTGFGVGVLRVIADMGQPLVLTLHDYWSLCPRGQMLAHDGRLCEAPEPDRCGTCLAATWPHLSPDRAAAEERTRVSLAALGLPDRLVYPSRAAATVFERAGVPPDRGVVIEHGVEVADLARAVARERDDTPGPLRVGILGSVQPSKGVLELIEALAEVDEPGLTLEIHGDLLPWHGDGSYVERVRSAAARDSRVTVHGPFEPEQLAAVLATLDAVAAPSLWEEVFGLSVREARAAGLPVLVSDRGGLPQVLEGGPGAEDRGADRGGAGVGQTGGRVLPAGDRQAWAAALAEWAGEPARAALSVRPPRSLEAMAADYAGLYGELIDAGPSIESDPVSSSGRGASGRPWWRRLLGR